MSADRQSGNLLSVRPRRVCQDRNVTDLGPVQDLRSITYLKKIRSPIGSQRLGERLNVDVALSCFSARSSGEATARNGDDPVHWHITILALECVYPALFRPPFVVPTFDCHSQWPLSRRRRNFNQYIDLPRV